ncbi:MAG TPA: peroxide stress protein YaaA [Candidatus Hungatella pullicola]|nr:peroxide stress protein YaaA [Candidatus Hungatella pullicola]
MKIIISPAKQMREETSFMEGAVPAFLPEAVRLRETLSSYTFSQLKTLYKANDKITEENYHRIRTMDLEKGPFTPAVLAYTGLQYQSMAPEVFSHSEWAYVKEHLFIISGFYGVLKGGDGVRPYRLEMQAKLSVDGKKDLYQYWGDKIYRYLTEDNDRVIVNLASKEYSRAVEPWVTDNDRFLSCVFGQEADGKIKVKATEAKIARGQMVRFAAEMKASQPEELKYFNRLGYRYREEYSGEKEYVFVKDI